MPLSAISGVSGITPALVTPAPKAVDGSSGSSFGDMLSSAVGNLQGLQNTSNQLAVAAVTGDLNDIHQATIASTRAAVTLELVSTVRNKGVEAFNEIMRMQA